MKQRTLTALILLVLGGGILLLSHLGWVMTGAAVFLSVMAVYELLRTAGKNISKWGVHGCLLLGAVLPLLPMEKLLWAAFPAGLLWLLGLMALYRRKEKFHTWEMLTLSALVAVFFRGGTALRQLPGGFWYLLAAAVLCAATDSGGFLAGKRFGRHKLAKRLSPGKTVEGAAGALALSLMLSLAFGTLLSWLRPGSVDFPGLILWSVMGSILAQVGDLSMSAVKRVAGEKDFGHLLPGHGGVLDRFDSFLTVLPFSFVYCAFTGGFFPGW